MDFFILPQFLQQIPLFWVVLQVFLKVSLQVFLMVSLLVSLNVRELLTKVRVILRKVYFFPKHQSILLMQLFIKTISIILDINFSNLLRNKIRKNEPMHLLLLNLHKLIIFLLRNYLDDFLKFTIMIKHHLQLFFIFQHQMLIIQKLEELFVRLLALSFRLQNLPNCLFMHFRNYPY